ncbi:MAG: carboxypeptidase, partial [Planctomycetes bacterium]|nr:carboxypeptidase [Planctomycetota bacterium]
MQPDFCRYYKHAELTSILRKLERAHPKLMKLRSIGRSPAGREIWLAEITKLGKPADQKPGYLVHGNIHASEVSGCTAALHVIWHLLEGGAGEPQVASLLDRMVFYIVPRINPDGPEAVLTLPQPIRSRKKKPLPEDEINGLIPQDINRDGLVLQMRVADENGDMRPSDKDPRLLVRRKPTDTQGPFYRVHPEGLIKDWDGFEIRPVNPQYDFNRNFAANWQMEYLQGGAGEHPYSAPEIKALADFAYAHPNICG